MRGVYCGSGSLVCCRYALWMDAARIFGNIQPPSRMCTQFIPSWRDGRHCCRAHRRWRWKGRPVRPREEDGAGLGGSDGLAGLRSRVNAVWHARLGSVGSRLGSRLGRRWQGRVRGTEMMAAMARCGLGRCVRHEWLHASMATCLDGYIHGHVHRCLAGHGRSSTQRGRRCHEVETDWRWRRLRSQYCSNTCATPPLRPWSCRLSSPVPSIPTRTTAELASLPGPTWPPPPSPTSAADWLCLLPLHAPCPMPRPPSSIASSLHRGRGRRSQKPNCSRPRRATSHVLNALPCPALTAKLQSTTLFTSRRNHSKKDARPLSPSAACIRLLILSSSRLFPSSPVPQRPNLPATPAALTFAPGRPVYPRYYISVRPTQ